MASKPPPQEYFNAGRRFVNVSGALFTAAATLLASAAFVMAASATRPARSRRRTADVSAFFTVTALYLGLSGLRQVAAFVGAVEADRLLFQALLLPAAAATVPLAHVTMRCLTTRPALRGLVVLTAGILVVVGLSTVYAQGIVGPESSYWGTEWALGGTASIVFLFLVVTLPGLAFSATVLRAGRQVGGTDGTRLRRVGLACLGYYVVFTLDALALPGLFLIAERLATMVLALMVYSAYHAPLTRAQAARMTPGVPVHGQPPIPGPHRR